MQALSQHQLLGCQFVIRQDAVVVKLNDLLFFIQICDHQYKIVKINTDSDNVTYSPNTCSDELDFKTEHTFYLQTPELKGVIKTNEEAFEINDEI